MIAIMSLRRSYGTDFATTPHPFLATDTWMQTRVVDGDSVSNRTALICNKDHSTSMLFHMADVRHDRCVS